MLNNKKILSNAILYSIGEIIPRVLSFLLLPILTTYLSTTEYGISSYTNSVMTFVFVIASLSLNTYLLKQFYIEDSIENRKNLVGSVFYFIFGFNVLLLIFQFFVFPKLITLFNINVPFYPYFWLAILNNFFDVIAIIPLVVYRVNENAKGFIFISLSRTLLQYVLVLIFVVYLGYGLEGSYYARLLANIPFVFIYLYIIKKNANFNLDFGVIKKALRFALPLLPGSVSYILISLSDRIILERYISLSQLGIYSVAFTLALALNVIIQALYKTIEPILFREFIKENFQEINSKIYKNYLALILIGGLGTALFSKEVFMLAASKSFLIGYKAVPFMVVAVMISGINIYLDLLLVANSRQKLVSYTTIASGIISLTLNLLLIPSIGYYGAIIASIISFATVNIYCQRKVYIKEKYFLAQLIFMLIIAFISLGYEYVVVLQSIAANIFVKVLLLFALSFSIFKTFKINPLKLLVKNS